MLRLTLFGEFSAAGVDGIQIAIKSKKAKALLAYLGLSPRKSRSREEIMALLWSDRGEAQARASLRQVLVGLRKDLGEAAEGALVVSNEAVALNPERVTLEAADGEEELLAGFHLHDPAFEEWLRDERLRLEGAPLAGRESGNKPLELPDKPSIAVLPFANLSDDPEQGYFADGIVEDLITALARFPWLFVIARNSSFSYKGKTVPVKQVSEELGVRYVVEGSVRRSETRLRVTAQLIDAVNDRHVWADSYDRPVGDLFDLQDESTRTITGVLVPALSSAERARFSRDNRPSLDAWEAYQKGLACYYQPYSDEGHRQARQLFDSAIELDPGIADSHVMIALMGVYAINSGQSSYSGSREEILVEALRAAERAVQLEDNNALGHTALGRLRGLMGDAEAGIAECETAVALNPNIAVAHYELGFVLFYAGVCRSDFVF